MNVQLSAAQEEYPQKGERRGLCDRKRGDFGGCQVIGEQERWTASIREKIEQGWSEAQDGMLISEEELTSELGSREAAWRVNAAGR